MEELEESLKKLCDSLDDFKIILELLNKYKKPEIVAHKLIRKKIEDGMLANLHNAKSYQIKTLKNCSYFIYYDMTDIEPILEIAYKKAVRCEKLTNINNLSE